MNSWKRKFCSCFKSKHKSIPEDPAHDNPIGLMAVALASKRYVRRISRLKSDDSPDDEQTKKDQSPDRINVSTPGSNIAKLPKLKLLPKGKKKGKKGTSSTESLIDDDRSGKETKETSMRNKLMKITKILSVSQPTTPAVENFENDPSRNKFRMVVLETMKTQMNNEDSSAEICRSLSDDYAGPSSRRNFDFYSSSEIGYQTEYINNQERIDDFDPSVSGEVNSCTQQQAILASTLTPIDIMEQERGEADGSSDVGINDDPTRECFGSVTFSVRAISPKAIGVRIISLQGLPCTKGRERGLCVEVTTTSGAQSVWLPIKNAKATKIKINNEVTVRLSNRSKKIPGEHTIRITLWPAGPTWKYSAIGSIIHPCLPLSSQEVTKLGIYQHTKTHLDLGLLELTISCVSEAPALAGKANKVNLCVDIVRAKLSQDLDVRKGQYVSKLIKGTKRDIWCRISVWKKGQRVDVCATTKSRIPVTNDPVFKTSSSFSLLRSSLQFTTLVIKLMIDKGMGEAVYGKVILGPHLYLGHPRENVAPGKLSHWGRALTHRGPVRAWHLLYL